MFTYITYIYYTYMVYLVFLFFIGYLKSSELKGSPCICSLVKVVSYFLSSKTL